MSRKSDIEKLIVNHQRRVQKLKEQAALYGLSVDPRIPIEIEDIEAEIKKLQAELEELESRVELPISKQRVQIYLQGDSSSLEIIGELEDRRSELSIAKAVLDELRKTGDTAAHDIEQRQQYIRRLEACIRQLEKKLKALGIQEPEVGDTSVPPPVPVVTGTTHPLPFDSLSPRDFERLCLWLAKREGFKRAEHLGAAGSEQGRDIIAWRKGELWAFQCKRVQRFGPKAALAEVEKVLALSEAERPVGLIFLVACDVSANTRQQARARCAGEMECHFWSGTELDEKVKRHSDIVEEFFQVS